MMVMIIYNFSLNKKIDCPKIMATILVFHDEVAFKFSSFLSSPDISWTNIENFSTAIFASTYFKEILH